jgi:hypothetical protein
MELYPTHDQPGLCPQDSQFARISQAAIGQPDDGDPRTTTSLWTDMDRDRQALR